MTVLRLTDIDYSVLINRSDPSEECALVHSDVLNTR